MTIAVDLGRKATKQANKQKGKVSEKLSTFSDGEAQRKKGDELNVPGVNWDCQIKFCDKFEVIEGWRP